MATGIAQQGISAKEAAKAITLADRLEIAMRARGIENRNQLAKAIKVTRQTVYYWFGGQTKNIDSVNLMKASAALGVRYEWLLRGEMPVYSADPPTDDELQIIGFYRRMSEEDRMVFMKMARTLAGDSDAKPSKADPYPRARP